MKKYFAIVALVSVLIVAALAVSPVNGGSDAASHGAAGDVVPNSYIVILQDGVSLDDVVSNHGVAKSHSYSSVFNGFAGTVPPGRLNALRNDPRVISISPNRVVEATGKPDNPGGGNNKKEDPTPTPTPEPGTPTPTPPPPPSVQVTPAGVERIGAAPDDQLGYTGAGVGVAIIDTGVDMLNPDLNVSVTCFTAYTSCQDNYDHGTHVAGIVGGLDNDLDIVGVASDATIYSVKVLSSNGSGTDAAIIGGLNWILSNASLVNPPIRVANMSLGRPASSDDSALELAVNNVVNAGITVVTSAGNSSSSEISGQVPAGFASVMAVASTTADAGNNSAKGRCSSVIIPSDTASYFTTDGAGVVISAPGEAQENVVKGCYVRSVGILSLQLGGGTTRMAGTSMAAPHVAGVVALLWEKNGSYLTSLLPTGRASMVASWIADGASGKGTAPLASPTGGYSFDGYYEGVLDAAGALSQYP